MICVGIFERDKKKRELLKSLLLKCLFEFDLEILWFTEEDYLDKMLKYSQRIQMACISLDNKNAKIAGRKIYERNPDCLICYYSEDDFDTKQVLNSRPISFFRISEKNERIMNELENMVLDLVRENKMFNFSTKKTEFAVPVRNILYFQSDLKHVVVHYCDGQEDRLFGKLQDIEKRLNEGKCRQVFLRIHKSYLANGLHMIKLDKSERMVEMDEHTRLPVSEAQYPQSVSWFEKNGGIIN